MSSASDPARFWRRCKWQAHIVAAIVLLGTLSGLAATASTFSVQQENTGHGVHAARLEIVNPCVEGDLTVPDGQLSADPSDVPCDRLIAGDVDVVSGTVRLGAGEIVEIRNGFSVASGSRLEIDVGDRVLGAAWLRDESPDAETSYAVRLAIDPDGLTFGADSDELEHFIAYDSEGNREFALGLGWNAGLGETRLWTEAIEDDGTVRTTEGLCELALSVGWQVIDLVWRASTGTNGDLVVTVNGTTAQSLAGDCLSLPGGLENSTGEISAVEWGARQIARGDLGTLDFDSFESRERGPIDSLSDLVISQVWGAGGNSGAPYQNDFIELFNPGSAPVSLAGRSLQYASATGSTWQVTALPGVLVEPGQYFLVEQSGGENGVALPPPDAAGTISMSSTQGKVALVDSTEALSGDCPALGIVDLVGYGGADCFEGSGAAPGLGSSDAALRTGTGCIDTDDTASDFVTGAPSPRTTATALSPCPDGVIFADGFESGDASRWASAPVPPALAISGVDYPVIAHGGRLALTGYGLAGATEVSIGGQVHTNLSAISETSVTVDAVSDATPVGPQPLSITTPEGTSAPFDLTVVHLTIAEIDPDTPGADDQEFYELDIGFDGQVSLDGYVLVHYNGADGAAVHAFDLDASGTMTGPDGLFLIGEPALPATPQIIDSFSIQGGEDAAAIYQFSSDLAAFPADYSTAGNAGVIDAVVWESSADPDSPTLYPLLDAGDVVDEGATSAEREAVSVQRCDRSAARRDGSTFGVAAPTPGQPNADCNGS